MLGRVHIVRNNHQKTDVLDLLYVYFMFERCLVIFVLVLIFLIHLYPLPLLRPVPPAAHLLELEPEGLGAAAQSPQLGTAILNSRVVTICNSAHLNY